MKNLTKYIATGAIVALMAPTLALAHDNNDIKSTTGLQVRIEKGIDRAEHRDEHRDERKDERKEHRDEHKSEFKAKHATSTASAITKGAVRIQAAADTMLSFNSRIAGLIASSSVETQAALQAKFAEFTLDVGSAKTEASAAAATAAQVNASNSTTTNASLIVSAKTDLKEARGFLHDAREAFFSILRSLWK